MTIPDGRELVPLLRAAQLLRSAPPSGDPRLSAPGELGDPDDVRLAAGSQHVADALVQLGCDRRRVVVGAPATLAGRSLDAVLLLDGEIVAAGPSAPLLISQAVDACRPGGLIAIAAPSQHGNPASTPPGLSAGHVRQLLSERGLRIDLLAAPGAAARLAGRAWAGIEDLADDRVPGLLDAGPVVLAAGCTPPDEAERSRRFFAQLPLKVVAASSIVRDRTGRLLIVFDSFRGAWTLPGGLVDRDELPSDGAAREAAEEGGVHVATEELLGVFCHPHPDRVHLVYEGRLLQPVEAPEPLHTHEIAEVRWCSLAEAETLLSSAMWWKVSRCLEEPGRTWRG